ncbi:MAG TPA: hypothetical protein VE377_09035 [Candidatus Dormibacteraeota bacterium]|nr:hypothetical protein [Candidatus Dormibacteraeota bacterium]
MSRIRHCVECPKCFTRYLISFSPYSNGAYLLPAVNGHWDEYILFCSCGRGSGASRWKGNEVMTCSVSKPAFERGYGTPSEILRTRPRERDEWTFDASQYLNDWKSLDRRKSS